MRPKMYVNELNLVYCRYISHPYIGLFKYLLLLNIKKNIVISFFIIILSLDTNKQIDVKLFFITI